MKIFTLSTMEHETSQMEQRHDLTLEQARHICRYFFGVKPWQARPVKTSGDHILMDNGNHYQFTGSMSDKASWDLIMQESVTLPIPKRWKA